MPCLDDLPKLVGFFSYSRDDDEGSRGALSALRKSIQEELRARLGRSEDTFELWQDKEAIASGEQWKAMIKDGVAKSTFFIPIITPRVVKSPHCKFELEAFLTREAELGRDDLVFPILYITVPDLEDSARQQSDPVLSIVANRQYCDWRELRFRDVKSMDVGEAVQRFCSDVCKALRRHWLTPEERKAQEEAAALERAEAERKRREAEAARAEEEARRKAEEEQARQRAEEERRRREAVAEQGRLEAERLRAEEQRLRRSFAAGVEPLRAKSDWIVALGFIYVLVGMIALGSVVAATAASVLVVGIMMIIAGAAQVVNAFQIKTWGKFLFWAGLGVLYIVAGFVAFENPLLRAVLLTLLLGAALVASGIVRIFLAFSMKEVTPWRWVARSGVVTLLVGLIILAKWPVSSLFVLGLFLGIDLVFVGASWIGIGLGLRKRV
jgi:uncharacterized membrane protein HdeD (DUF308 family)